MRYFATCIIKDRLPQLHSVDDIVQDAFVALWERRQAFASERSVKAFLYTAVRNSCLNLLRHQDVRQRYTNSAARGGYKNRFWMNCSKLKSSENCLKPSTPCHRPAARSIVSV